MEPKKDIRIEIIVKDNVFSGSNLAVFVHKKTVKISKVLYLITDIIDNEEEIKKSLRKIANSLVIKDTFDTKKTFKEVALNLNNLKSVLELGVFSGAVSHMNAMILVREIDNILEVMFDEKEQVGPMISKVFFSVERDFHQGEFSLAEKDREVEQTIHQSSRLKGHLKDTNKSNMSFKSVDVNNIVSDNYYKKDSSSAVVESGRKDLILNIIKDKKEVSIKDISSHIKDVSEKTIQRDLTDMVDGGIIKKTGERRWSKYSL